MTLRDTEITVLGAGVAGLAVARALALRGARVIVLERADAIREVGAGLQVSPNGAAVLHALGLGDVGDQARAVRLIDGVSGQGVTTLDMARLRPDQPYRFTHRADLIALLRDGAEAAGAEIRLLSDVTGITLREDGADLTLTNGMHSTPFLIGADGLKSQLRQTLNGTIAPFFTHQVAWRALIPGDGGPPEAEVHMGKGRHLVSYPLRGGTLRNIVAVEERHRWTDEGWSIRADALELQLAFESFAPRVRDWLAQVDQVWLWGLFRHPVARRWTAPAAAILGDAAHPTLPFLAQGANMALEDAWTLAEALDQTDRAKALSDWQATRSPRCARIVAAADRNAKIYHLGGLPRVAAHLGMRALGAVAPNQMLRRFDWIYTHDVTAQAARSTQTGT